jgi:hypothetical protein
MAHDLPEAGYRQGERCSGSSGVRRTAKRIEL